MGAAGFKTLDMRDSAEESQRRFEMMMAGSDLPPMTMQVFLGDDIAAMVRNRVRNLTDRRTRTLSYICQA